MPSALDPSHPAAPLLRALQNAVLPALETSVRDHLVIARSRRKQLALPPGVHAVPMKRRGRRVAVRAPKTFERAVLLSARWPADGMHEMRTPKIAIVVRGQVGLRAGDYVLQCPTGTVIFLPPGVPRSNSTFSHLETLPPDIQHCSLLWLTPMMSGLACRMCHTTGENHRGAAEGEKVFLQHPQVMQLFNLLAEEVENQSAGNGESPDTRVLESLLLCLMRALWRDIAGKRFLLQEVPPHENAEYSASGDPLDQAVQYLGTHFAGPLVLDDVARRFLFSRADFTRKFRERTGQSFLEFLNVRRLEQARKYLRETDWTAAMIAHYVGFASPAHFHHLFRRETGQTPMQFREAARAAPQKISE
jgi:AraC-like DNA-binding protein